MQAFSDTIGKQVQETLHAIHVRLDFLIDAAGEKPVFGANTFLYEIDRTVSQLNGLKDVLYRYIEPSRLVTLAAPVPAPAPAPVPAPLPALPAGPAPKFTSGQQVIITAEAWDAKPLTGMVKAYPCAGAPFVIETGEYSEKDGQWLYAVSRPEGYPEDRFLGANQQMQTMPEKHICWVPESLLAKKA